MIPNIITHVKTDDNIAALTFDDGPDPASTPKVLDILEKHNAKATFFMIGQAAGQHPKIVKEVAAHGHAIGNHSWYHTNLTKIDSRLKRMKQLMACSRATKPYHQRLFRPPFGKYNRKILLDAVLLRYKVILWSASAQDWKPQHPEQIAQKMISRIVPGTIFLLHDSIQSETKNGIEYDRRTMINGLDIALPRVMAKMRLITLPDLLTSGSPACSWPLQ